MLALNKNTNEETCIEVALGYHSLIKYSELTNIKDPKVMDYCKYCIKTLKKEVNEYAPYLIRAFVFAGMHLLAS